MFTAKTISTQAVKSLSCHLELGMHITSSLNLLLLTSSREATKKFHVSKNQLDNFYLKSYINDQTYENIGQSMC